MALDKRLTDVIALPVDKSLFGEWIVALADSGKAKGAALDAEHEMAAAFDRYVQAMMKTSPPYLKSITVSAGGQKVYAANWAVKQSAGTSRPNSEQRRKPRIPFCRS